MRRAAFIEHPWREPCEVLAALGDRVWTLGLLSVGGWSYVAADPVATRTLPAEDPSDALALLEELRGPISEHQPEGPPFQGGVAGLLSYELGARFEGLGLARHDGWPDLACARYDALLAFDHRRQRVVAVGRGEDAAAARGRADAAAAWLSLRGRAARAPTCRLRNTDSQRYERAVAETIARIGAGEIFQANLARSWHGRLARDGSPLDLLLRLAAESPAPFAAYLRLPGRAVVSNSPERFISLRRRDGAMVAVTQPIKGTAPRGATPREDQALAAALLDSTKDRAENLMIVDLMRNDLARVCRPGTVRAPELFRLATFANVHHLVSEVTGQLSPDTTALDLIRATFPPGSITGAPKLQAMKVIAALEGPRGPFFGSMVWLGSDGAMDSNVMIRTAAFVRDARGWRLETRAGAGIVSDSDPVRERCETEAKMSAIAAAVQARTDCVASARVSPCSRSDGNKV